MCGMNNRHVALGHRNETQSHQARQPFFRVYHTLVWQTNAQTRIGELAWHLPAAPRGGPP